MLYYDSYLLVSIQVNVNIYASMLYPKPMAQYIHTTLTTKAPIVKLYS